MQAAGKGLDGTRISHSKHVYYFLAADPMTKAYLRGRSATCMALCLQDAGSHCQNKDIANSCKVKILSDCDTIALLLHKYIASSWVDFKHQRKFL